MPVTPTYPGLYIEEILSNSHTITAAPTSVTVFVGYTHPFKTVPEHYGQAVQIFSFTDYEREFGGLFDVDWLADDVGRAVFQFFANGGAVAWVAALRPSIHSGTTTSDLPMPTLTLGSAATGITFTGREPVDGYHQLTVAVSNPKRTDPEHTTKPLDIADITIGYAGRSETFRHVTLNPAPPPDDAANTLEQRVGTAENPVSALVTVAPSGAYPTQWPNALAPQALASGLPTGPFTTFAPGDFTGAFASDGALDKLAVFNLLLTPGVWDLGVVSAALAFAERKHAFMIVDPPADAAADRSTGDLPMIGDIMSGAAGPGIPKSTNGALYFPYLLSPDPATGAPLTIAPSGFVAGVIAREDNNRGVWKGPPATRRSCGTLWASSRPAG